MAQNAGTTEFSVSMTGQFSAVRAALKDLHARLEALAFSADALGTIEIVLAEALNNVCEHAYPDTPGGIRVTCKSDRNGLHIVILDHGAPMPACKTPQGDSPMVDPDFSDLPEGGFGWFLIHTLATDVTYTRQNSQNVLSLRMAMLPEKSELP